MTLSGVNQDPVNGTIRGGVKLTNAIGCVQGTVWLGSSQWRHKRRHVSLLRQILKGKQYPQYN